MDSLIAAILDIRRSLRDGSITSEDQVSKEIVRRLLRELGWTIDNPSQVRSEYVIGGGKVDYALVPTTSRPEVLIEVKRVGRIETRGEMQLFAYCAEQPGLLAVLTDGRTWSFYLPKGRSDYEKHRFATLDLGQDEESKCAEMLDRYLGFDAVFSGHSREDAFHDHGIHTEGIAKQSVPQDPVPAEPQITAAPVSVGDHGPVRFALFGETFSCPTNQDRIHAIFEKLFEKLTTRNPSLCEECARKVGRVRRKREDFSPQDQGRKTLRQLSGGWWIDVWGNSRKWEKRIRAACEAAEIKYGRDLVLLPRRD